MATDLGRILVVDDEVAVGDMISELLTELGYVVKTAVRGAEALQVVPVFRPDAVLLDLKMPGMPGTEVLRHLRHDYPLVPVIIVTGNTDVEVARQTIAAGACDYLSKPFALDVLARAVGAAVALKSAPDPAGDPSAG
jgi:CheY-like chemotaxis protein